MWIAAVDQGTTSTRCILFDREGRAASCARRAHATRRPRPGWVEQDALEIAAAADEAIREAMERVGARSGDLAAVGVTNQRETFLLWERATGRPVTPALVWQDTRSQGVVAELREDPGDDFLRRRSGLPAATYFSGPKLRFCFEQDPELLRRAERGELLFGTMETWLVHHLTGGERHVSDVTNASRTLLFDLSSLDWSDELLEVHGVPRAILPRVVASADAEAYGTTSPSGAFGGRVRIAAALGDQQSALVGHGVLRRGDAKNTYGTGCFLLAHTGGEPRFSRHGLLTTVAYRFGAEPAAYALEGSVAYAGALLDWFRDELEMVSGPEELERLARTVDDAGGAVLVPAFSGLFAPRWRADARGVLVGLTRSVTRAHLCRAALEAVAHQTADVYEAMSHDLGSAPPRLCVDGGLARSDLLLQLQSDLLGVEIRRPAEVEITARGAALAAGAAVGVSPWPVVEPPNEARFLPRGDVQDRTRERTRWRAAVERSLGWTTDSPCS